jgi:hypothetical protein
VYCEACCARDRNWLALDWVDKSTAEPELDELLLLAPPPTLTILKKLKPPPPDTVVV